VMDERAATATLDLPSRQLPRTSLIGLRSAQPTLPAIWYLPIHRFVVLLDAHTMLCLAASGCRRAGRKATRFCSKDTALATWPIDRHRGWWCDRMDATCSSSSCTKAKPSPPPDPASGGSKGQCMGWLSRLL